MMGEEQKEEARVQEAALCILPGAQVSSALRHQINLGNGM